MRRERGGRLIEHDARENMRYVEALSGPSSRLLLFEKERR
jgi:hypothetical protein